MKTRWKTLSKRDRRFVSHGSILVLILISYFYVWSPFVAYVNNLQQKIQYQQHLLHLMHQASQQLQTNPINHRHKVVSQNELLSIIAKQLHQANLASYPHQLHQAEDGKIQLEFSNVPFDEFMSWLWELFNDNACEITKLTVKAGGEPGIVQLSIIIKV